MNSELTSIPLISKTPDNLSCRTVFLPGCQVAPENWVELRRILIFNASGDSPIVVAEVNQAQDFSGVEACF